MDDQIEIKQEPMLLRECVCVKGESQVHAEVDLNNFNADEQYSYLQDIDPFDSTTHPVTTIQMPVEITRVKLEAADGGVKEGLPCSHIDDSDFEFVGISGHPPLLINDSQESTLSCTDCETLSERNGIEGDDTQHTAVKKSYLCSECDAHFTDDDDLARHLRMHSDNKPFMENEEKYVDSGDTDEVEHPGNKKRYPCSECDAIFASTSGLTYHRRTHKGEKPYRCAVCDSRFTQKSQLTIHARHHSGEKPYVCDRCGAKFVRHEHLINHDRVHTGEKPYACDQCDSKFSQKAHLTVHLRLHSGSKPHACDQCRATFARSERLTIHKRGHTGERPFLCMECGARFMQGGDLIKHKKKHVGITAFGCTKCDARFTRVHSLNRHKKMHSNEKS